MPAARGNRNIVLKTAIPGPKSKALQLEVASSLPAGLGAPEIFVESAKGALLKDVDGNQFIDLVSGRGTAALGHAFEAVYKPAATQAGKMLAGLDEAPHPSLLALCAHLIKRTPGDFPKKALPLANVAQARDWALRLARAYTKRPLILAIGQEETSRASSFPPEDKIIYAPAPYSYRTPATVDVAFERLERIATVAHSPEMIAAIKVSPFSLSAGGLLIPTDFLERLSRFCAQHHILMIADESECGCGSAGAFLASEQLSFCADMTIIGDGVGGGFPIAAIVGRAEVMDWPKPGELRPLAYNNPVAITGALGTLAFINDSVLARARTLGESTRKTMNAWAEASPLIGEIRGLGTLLAVELVKSRASREPFASGATRLARYALEKGVLVTTAGARRNCVLVTPPLSITDDQMAEALAVLESGLKTLRIT